MSTSHSKVVVDRKSDLSSSWKPVRFLGFLFLETDLLELGILIDLVQSRSNLRVQHLEIWKNLSANWSRELQFFQWINHLHLIDPQHRIQWKIRTCSRLILASYLPHQQRLGIQEFVELQLRYLLSLRSNHSILRKFRCYRTHSRRLSCKCRHWICVFTLLVISCEKSFRPCCLWNWPSFSLWCARVNSLRMISGCIKRRKLITKNVSLWSRCIPCVKRQAFVAAQHGTRTWNHCRLTGNVVQPSTIIWFHFLKFSRIIHLFLHLLQLGSELLYCLMTLSIFAQRIRQLVVLELSSIFFHFMNTSGLSVLKCFLFHF